MGSAATRELDDGVVLSLVIDWADGMDGATGDVFFEDDTGRCEVGQRGVGEWLLATAGEDIDAFRKRLGGAIVQDEGAINTGDVAEARVGGELNAIGGA